MLGTSLAQAEITDVTLLNPLNYDYAYGGANTRHRLTITLADPAEAGGHAVDILSSDASLGLSRATVIVPEGETSHTFMVASSRTVVPASVVATVLATDEDNSMESNDFTVRPMQPSFVPGNTTTFLQGNVYTYTVKLSARLQNEQTIAIACDNPGVSVEDAVIPANESTATFSVTVDPSATGNVMFTASFNGFTVKQNAKIVRMVLKSMTANSTATAGSTVAVTLNLMSLAVGDQTVAITYSGPAAAGAPASAVISNGTKSVVVHVPTKTFTSGTKTLIVTGSLNGESKMVRIQVSP